VPVERAIPPPGNRETIPTRANPDQPRARRLPSRVHDATNPPLLKQRRGREGDASPSSFVSLCLADECYRPNCQRVAGALSHRGSAMQHDRVAEASPAGPRGVPLDIIGRCKATLRRQLAPAVFRVWFVREADVIIPRRHPKSNPRLRIILDRFGYSRGSESCARCP